MSTNDVPATSDVLDELQGQLDRYDPKRFPVQHATASFHLGTVLVQRGELDAAVAALRRACELFPADGLPLEHGKAANMLGVAERERSNVGAAVAAFSAAADLLDRPGSRVEAAASRFNLGLALRDEGRLDDARAALTAALEVFEEADAREHAAAAARELGTTLLGLGQLDAAVTALERAVDLARRAGDRACLGTASNVLGIVHLHADRDREALDAFDDAAGAHPRSVRPAEHAMARANAALAAWRSERPALAALAARQALAIEAAAPEVRTQARELLASYDGPDPLAAVLRDADDDAARGTLRSELARLGDIVGDEATAHAEAVVTLIAEDPHAGKDLAEVWLDVLLEQPPGPFRRLVEAVEAEVAAHDDAETLRAALGSAMARFHVPQWMRLRDTFNAVAEACGREPNWR